MSRQNQWFVPGNDIAREVITADIQRYLGPDALVRPGVGTGDYQGQPGYWITAYRTLTSQMIQDLRLDSQRWQAERQPEAGRGGGGVAYQDSQTHAARQHWGPTTPYEQAQQAQQPQPHSQSSRVSYDDRRDPKQTSRTNYQPSPYGQSAGHYTTNPPYETSPYTGGAATEPRTTPQTTSYHPSQPSRQDPQYQTQQYYPSQAADPYARTTTAQSPNPYPQSQAAAPGYYIASDGRQYPLSQQPTPQRGSGPGGRR